MRRRVWSTTISLSIVLLLVAGIWYVKNRKTPRQESDPGDAELANAFIEAVEHDERYRMGSRDVVAEQIAAKRIDVQALFRGSVAILRRGEPEERRKAACVLGRLGNPAAIQPLVETLDDSDDDLRVTACYALQWLGRENQPAAHALVELCRVDPSINVRVAAARALNGSNEVDAVAAYSLGLQSTDQDWVRALCEDELEKRGKLELPLPEDIYWEISYETYRKIKEDRWYLVRREVEKEGTIFFEAVERVHHAPWIPHWYRTKASRHSD